MIAAISILAVALLGAVGILAFAPLPEGRRGALKAVMTSAAAVAVVGMALGFAVFLGLALSGRQDLSKVSIHAMTTALAFPFVIGTAAVGFGALAVCWANVFERPNDRFAANLYVMIAVAILVLWTSGSLHDDWSAYLTAAALIPSIPALANRKIRRERQPAGFASAAAKPFLAGRAVQSETRWAEPVIAPRKPKVRKTEIEKPEPQKPRSLETVAARRTQERRTDAAAPAAKEPLKPAATTRAANKAMVAMTAAAGGLAVLAGNSRAAAARVGAVIGSTAEAAGPRLRAASAAIVAAVPKTPVKPAIPIGKEAAQRPVGPRASVARRTAPLPATSSSGTAARGPVREKAVKTPEEQAREQPKPSPTKTESARPMPKQAPRSLPPAKPSLLPSGVAPVSRKTDRAASVSRPAPAIESAQTPATKPSYPLTAQVEPGSDRWATYIDGVLTTETGITRKIAARSTQALDDVQGAA